MTTIGSIVAATDFLNRFPCGCGAGGQVGSMQGDARSIHGHSLFLGSAPSHTLCGRSRAE